MAYKTIIAILQDEKAAVRVLDVAVGFAERFDAHIVGIHSEPLPVPIASPMGFPDATIIGTADEFGRERAEKLRGLFEARRASERISAEWRSMRSFSGDSALSAVDSARCGDIVVACRGPQDGGGAPDIETVLQRSGRPVLLVPYEGPVSAEAKRILVAWNGSREAARATFDALDLIVAAEETIILTVNPVTTPGEDGPLPGNDIAAALARHGANVTVESARSGDRGVAGTLARVVADRGVDLLVAGAFGKSRLREMLFGGTTRSLLDAPPCLTLMSA